MAVSVDAVSSGDTLFNNVTSFTNSGFTFGATATAATASIVFCSAKANATPTSVAIKWNNVAMSIVSGADTGFLTGTTNKDRAVIYALGSPTTGNHTFNGSWTNSYSGYANIMSWKGSDTTTPCKNGTTNTATSTSASVVVTSPAGDFAVGCLAEDGTSTTISSMGATSWWLDNGGAAGNGGGNYKTGAGSTTLTATISASDLWAYAACDVQVPVVVSTDTEGFSAIFRVQPKTWY